MATVTHTYTTGSGTETAPAGARSVQIINRHGGAAGGRDSTDIGGGGGGGGAGEATRNCAGGDTFAYAVAAQVAGRSSNGNGTNGNVSTVTGSPTGGATVNMGGTAATGGQTGSTTGSGGTSTGGDTNFTGGNAPSNVGGAGADGGGTAGNPPGGGGSGVLAGTSGAGQRGQIDFIYQVPDTTNQSCAASTSPAAKLTRAAAHKGGLTSSALAAALVRSAGKAFQTTTTPTKSVIRAPAAKRQTTSAPVARLVRAVATNLPRLTFPVASLANSTGANRQSSSAPVTTLQRGPAVVRRASSAPVASLSELLVFLRSLPASSAPIATAAKGMSVRALTVAITVASVMRNAPRTFRTMAGAIASLVRSGGPILQTTTHPVVSETHGAPNILQAVTAPVTRLLRAMTRKVAISVPSVGTPYLIARGSAGASGSGLVLKTFADAPAGSIIVVVAAQFTGPFASALDDAGNAYTALDGNAAAGGTPIWSTVFFSDGSAFLPAGSFITLADVTVGQLRAASVVCIPSASPLYTLDTSGNFVAGTGTGPSATTAPLAFAGEIAIGYMTNPAPGTGFFEEPGFSTMDANVDQLGLHVAAKAVLDTDPVNYSPNLGVAQDYGVNVITFQTGWIPLASLTRSVNHLEQLAASLVALLTRSAGKQVPATSSPVASLSPATITSAVLQALTAPVALLLKSLATRKQAQSLPVALLTRADTRTMRATTSPVALFGVIKVKLQSALASTSPLASLVRGAGKVVQALAAVAARLTTSTAHKTQATVSPVAGLTRSAGKPLKATSSPLASLTAFIVSGTLFQATAAATARLVRSAGKMAQGASSPLARLVRAVAAGRQASTAPVARLTRSTGPTILQALAVAAASLARSAGAIRRAATAPIASHLSAVILTRKQTSTAPVATNNQSRLHVVAAQALAAAIASLTRVLGVSGRRFARFIRGRRF